MTVRAQLLGTVVLHLAGESREMTPAKRTVLLAIIACRAGGWMSRDELTLLLWGSVPEIKARRNLRQMLHELGKSDFATALDVEDTRVRFVGESDVAAFRAACAGANWREALEHWRDARSSPFLSGWTLPREPAIDAWIAETRSELERGWIDAATAYAAQLEWAGDLVGAAQMLGRVWRADTLEEGALRRQLWLLQQAGSAQEAAREARVYRETFETELGSAPIGHTSDLLVSIEAEEPVAEPEEIAASRTGPPPLPSARTPFIGRASELDALLEFVRDPDTRLVTLLGLGGAGKTRLALAAAQRRRRDGVRVGWAPLASAESDAEVLVALAGAWGLRGADAVSIGALVERIGRQAALLVIDNAEHVVDGVREIVHALLEACPSLTVMVTSRVALGMRAEQRFTVDGLENEGAHSDAAALFVACSGRRSPTFAAETEPETVVEICHALGGFPLALELAASWADLLTPAQLLAELRRGLELLEGGWQDAPERQHGLAAILDATWNRLGDTGREAMLALAPCRGGADLAAARALGASADGLRELLDRALLQRSGVRFSRHPLVVRDARRRAEADPDRWSERRRKHAEHFLHALEPHYPAVTRGEGRLVLDRLEPDLPNLRAALLWAVEHADPDRVRAMNRAVMTLEGSYGRARDHAMERELLERSQGRIRLELEIAQTRATDADAEARLESLRDQAKNHGDLFLESRVVHRLALAAHLSGDLTTAEAGYRTAIALGRQATPTPFALQMLAGSYGNLAVVLNQSGRFGAGHRSNLRCVALARRGGSNATAALFLLNLGQTGLRRGDYVDALRYARASVDCLPEGALPLAHVKVLNSLAQVHAVRGEDALARQRYHEVLGWTAHLAGGALHEWRQRAHRGLASLALCAGNPAEAARWLDDAGEGNSETLRLLAQLAAAEGDDTLAVTRLERARASVRWHSASPSAPGARPEDVRIESQLVSPLLRLGRKEAARDAAHAALEAALACQEVPELLRALVACARLLHSAGDTAHALRLLARVLEHPATKATVRGLAASLISEVGIEPDALAAYREQQSSRHEIGRIEGPWGLTDHLVAPLLEEAETLRRSDTLRGSSAATKA